MHRAVRLGLLLILIGLTSRLASAQDNNLLRDSGFEGSYTSRGRGDLNIPADWSIWMAESPHTEDWMNLPVVAFPHNGPSPMPHGGAHSLNLNKGYATFTAAVYQQVSVPSGSNVAASAWAFLRTCKIPDGYDTCTSTPESNAVTRIGIDPNGGTNPFDSDVVWSANAAPHETWEQMSVSATATGDTVTLFLYASQQWPAQLNNVYWDDAALSIGGGGGIAAAQPGAPTPAPTSEPQQQQQQQQAPQVSAQGARPDGSVVYVVQPGDTLDSIAFAYGVTRADLLALNNIADPRIIQIGQEITIRAAPTPTPTLTPEGYVPPTPAPPAEVLDAAPAPVISMDSGTVVYPIDPTTNTASICVTLFDDENGNRLQDGGEATLAGGDIVLTQSGQPAGEHTTDASPDPYCFDALAAGNYSVGASAPPGYGLTTPDQLRVQAHPAAQVNVAFGAAKGVQPIVLPPPSGDDSADEPAAEAATQTAPPANPLRDNIGLIVFGAAGVVLVAGMGISLALRRR